MLLDIVLFVVSLGVLIYASDRFIGAAESIGLSLGVSPFIIGVTIVAFGTSLPELATSIASVFAGNSQIVIGNVIGSNITNILLVLGLTAFVGRDILLDFDVMDVDMPLLLVSAFLLFFVISDLYVSIFEAILLLICLGLFLYNSLGSGRDDDVEKTKVSAVTYLTVLIAGVFVFLGAKYTITSISSISESMGIGEDVIALTAVALGTSLPEVMVSIAAARRGKHAIAVGNVLGSNIFNTYAVTGIPALLGSIVIPADTIHFSAPFMIFVTLIFAFMCVSRRISKWEGVTLLVLYAFFLGETFQRGI